MILVVEGCIAKVPVGTVYHHAAVLVVVSETNAVMVNGIQAHSPRHGIRQIEAHHNAV